MNVYDFDETIYDGDSSRDFCIYIYKKFPRAWLYLPKQLYALVRYMRGKIDKTAFKEAFFSIFRAVPDIETEIETFWALNDHKILPYYPPQSRTDDIVISASPLFIVAPMCRRLGLTQVLASDVDAKTGAFHGENCYGTEKVRRFLEAGYDPKAVQHFYSDSMSDTPLAELAEEAFIVTKKGLTGWVPPKQKGMQAFFTLFNKPNALISLGLGAANLLLAGHLARLLVQQRKWSAPVAYGTGFAATSAFLFAGLAMKANTDSRLQKVLNTLAVVLPTIFGVQFLVASAVFAMIGMPIVSLGLATVSGLPLLYLGVRFLFLKKKF